MAVRPPLVFPTDEPVVSVPGPDPDRIVLIGSGPAAGVGVRTHQLGLAGTLARALGARTRRGAAVEAIGRADLRITEVPALVRDARLTDFDLVVIVAGTMEAVSLVGAGVWRDELRAVLDDLRDRGARDTRAAIVGMPPLTSLGFVGGVFGRIADRRAALLNRMSEDIASLRPDAAFVRLSAPRALAPLPTSDWYADWGSELADQLSIVLDDIRERPAVIRT